MAKDDPIASRRIMLLNWFLERGVTPRKVLSVMRPTLTQKERSKLLAVFKTSNNAEAWKEWDLIKRNIKRTDGRNDGRVR